MLKLSKSELTFRLVLALATTLLLTATAVSQDSIPSNDSRVRAVEVNGESKTVLPDGQLLQIGGDDVSGAPRTSASIQDPESGVVAPLASHLRYARAWHTATVLPNGKVAIIGGLGRGRKTVPVIEQFDPASEQFSGLPVAGITARSHHTATLLTDGAVLIVGGVSANGRTLGDGQLWNPRTGQVSTVPGRLGTPRRDHFATLQSDGTVLIYGGKDAKGSPVNTDEIYDPTLQKFSFRSQNSSSSTDAATDVTPRLAGSIPKNGAMNVPTDTIISLRFSQPMEVDTVTGSTIVLEGPGGSVPSTVVLAEGGILAFVNLQSALASSAAYTVTVSGAMGASGVQMPNATIRFTTTSVGSGSGGGGGPVGPPTGPGGPGSPKPGVWIPTSDWYTHLPPSRWQSLPPLHAPRGVTALSGQVLTIDGSPLANVTLQVGTYTARSDGTGRFLISGLPAGLDALLIDGTSANHGGLAFGIFQPGVSVTAKVTNVLPYTIWMPVIDTAHAVTIAVPTTSETVAVSPLIPGLELHLPAGSEIIDVNGQLVHAVTITPIPLDRPPFPLPAGVVVPIYFTIQPGLAKIQTPSGGRAGAWLVYPNTGNLPVGASFNFWNYDLSWSGWWIYGHGAVGAGGAQVFPNPGVHFYKLSGAMVGNGSAPPVTQGNDARGGEPVDCSTGIFIHTEQDLRLADVIPLALQRTYLSQDGQSRSFGFGFTDNYEIFLTAMGQSLYSEIFLILPDGEEVAYKNTNSDTSDYVHAHLVPTSSSNPSFYGSKITWNGNGWNLRLRNGTIFAFPDSFVDDRPAKAALTSITDRYGNTVTILRDNNGNKTQIISPNGRWIQLQSDSNNRITQATDNLGRTVTYTYDSYNVYGSGRPSCNSQHALCAVTDANGGITSYTYDGGNRMLTITDPRGNTQLTNTYEPASGRVATQTLADGTSTYYFSYIPSSGKITQTTIIGPNDNLADPNHNAEVKDFDGNGFLTSDVIGSGSSVQQTFNFVRDGHTELIASMTDQLGRETAYEYDADGNRTSTTRLAGTQQAVTYTLAYEPIFSQLTSISDPLSHKWTLGRDGSGNLTSITDPRNDSISMTYDHEGRPLTVADAYSDTIRFDYSGADLASITDPLGNTKNGYADSAGRLIGVRDALGQSTLIAWDALDRITQITDPNLSVTSFTYDANSNLLSRTDANGNLTSYAYDSRNRATSRVDGLGVSESYGYDGNSNLTGHTDRRGKATAFQYDALNRITFTGFGQSGSEYESTISYAWDGGNRLTGATDSIAGTITRVPDLLDRFTSETTSQGSITYAYDDANRRTTMQVAGQPQVSYAWDDANRLTGIAQGSSTQGISAVGIGYDNANRRTSLTLPNGVTVAYNFDNDSHITGLTYSTGGSQLGNLIYGYDAVGRVTSKGGTLAATNLPASVVGNTFNADNGMTAFAGAILSYDANGNLTSDGANDYTWDARNHLTGISRAAIASFTYDAFGRRASKSISAMTTQFLYDRMNPVQEIQGSAPSANLLTGRRLDEYFARMDSSNNNVSTLLTDALWSTIGLVGSAQSIATSYTYQPFGATANSGQTSANSYQFTGRENDGTGLYFYRGRYYSATLQRFISQDPIGFAGGDTNLYAYVANQPVNSVDPFGLDAIVSLYPGYDVWPFGTTGHVGISIVNENVDTGNSVGFYPANNDWTIPVEVPGAVLPDTQLPEATIDIPTTAEQDQAMLDYMKQIANNPGLYTLPGSDGTNCTVFVRNVLDAGKVDGLPPDSDPLHEPRRLFNQLPGIPVGNNF